METAIRDGLMGHGFPDIFSGVPQHGGTVRLVSRRWGEYTRPKAAVFLVHGLGEHCGRYEALGEHLQKHRIATFSFDHRGHGRSGGLRCYAEHIDEFVLDLHNYYELVLSQLPHDLPLFVMGHSMGGEITILWTLKYREVLQKRLSGVILSSPAVAPGEEIGAATIYVAQALAKVAPQAGIQAFAPERISTIVEEQRLYATDELNFHGSIPASIASALLGGLEEIGKHHKQFDYPLLLFFGTDDKLVNINAAEVFYSNCASKEKSLFKVEGSEHETLRDKDRDMVMDRLRQWIEERSAAK